MLTIVFLLLSAASLAAGQSDDNPATSTAPELTLGYPTKLTMTHKAELCPVQLQVPANTAKLRILVDLGALVSVAQDVTIYAQPGAVVQRTGEHRVSADQVGDTEITLANPVPGLWSIGVYGECVLCDRVVTGKMQPRLSAALYTVTSDPIVELVPDVESAAMRVLAGRMGFFSFKLTAAATVHFAIKLNPLSTLDGIKTYLRNGGFPDLNDPALNDPLQTPQLSLSTDASISGGVQRIGSVLLQPGSWTLAVKAENVVGTQLPAIGGGFSTSFTIAYAVGAKPTFAATREVVCPTAPAKPETGTWDKCALIDDCQTCLETPSCGYCRIRVPGSKWDYSSCQTIDASGKCQAEFELYPDARVTDKALCSKCQPLACDACIKNPTCSWCAFAVPNPIKDYGFGSPNYTLFGCEDGITCKASYNGIGVVPLTDASKCNAKVADINLKGLERVLTNFTQAVLNGINSTGSGVSVGNLPGFGPATGGAPPVSSDGKLQLPPCPNYVEECASQCKATGVKSCGCNPMTQKTDVVCKTAGDGQMTAAATAAPLAQLAAAALLVAATAAL